VVLLGDSYSAGNGAGGYVGPEGCYRSSRNWAERYLTALRSVRNVTFVNRACSGGVISDVRSQRFMGTRETTIRVAGIAGKDDEEARRKLDDSRRCARQDDELFRDVRPVSARTFAAFTLVKFACDRYMDSQVNSVSRDTDLVLMTIGGNDADFDQIVAQCFVVVERSPRDCRTRIEAASGLLESIGSNTLGLIRDLRRRLRADAKIALAGYPQLEVNEGYRLKEDGVEYEVGRKLREFGRAADAKQKQIVDGANGESGARVVYIDDVKEAFAGREPDGRATARNPNRWIHEFEGLKAEWYHPNSAGHDAYARLFASRGDFGVSAPPSSGSADIVFVVDTTGSMGGAIDSAKAAARDLVRSVSARTTSARFALVDYRDFPERTGDPGDYPAKLRQDFTSDPNAIDAAVQELEVAGGGDTPETMFSALKMAYDLNWRPGVKKMTVVLADAPPLSPEPISGLTKDDIIAQSLSIDPVELHIADVGAAVDQDAREIAQDTNGGIYEGDPSQAAVSIDKAIDTSLQRPYAWAGGPYVTHVGEPVTFDARGSYAISGTIVKYEWDVDGDGTYDLSNAGGAVQHTYTGEFSGFLGVRVTDSQGREAIATVPTTASRDGDTVPELDDNCPDSANSGQEDEDKDGVGDPCDPTPGFATADLPGVSESIGEPPASGAAGAAEPAPPGPSGGPAEPAPPPPSGVPAQAAPPAAVRRAAMTLSRPRLVRRGRAIRLTARCRRTSTCQGTLRLNLAGRTIRKTLRVRAGRSVTVTVTLPARVRRAFGGGRRVTVRATVTMRDRQRVRAPTVRLRRS